MNVLEKIEAITYSIEKVFDDVSRVKTVSKNLFKIEDKLFEVSIRDMSKATTMSKITFKLEDKIFEVIAKYDRNDCFCYYDYIPIKLEGAAHNLCLALDIDVEQIISQNCERNYGLFSEAGKKLEKLLIKALEESRFDLNA